MAANPASDSAKAEEVVTVQPDASSVDPDGTFHRWNYPDETFHRWNSSASNIRKVLSCFWAFVVLGAHAGAFGPLIPYMEDYYHLTYIQVSLIFLAPFLGSMSAALLNNWVHEHFGRRGVALFASSGHVFAYVIIALHPPFPVVVIAFVIAQLAGDIGNAGWSAFLGSMANGHQLLGFLHGFFGLGAVASPLVASFMYEKAGLPWYYFHWFMVGLSGVEFLSLATSFWSSTGADYRESVIRDETSGESKGRGTLKEAVLVKPFARVTWLVSLFLLGYVGTELAVGGWIVVFMVEVRKATDFVGGLTATGFWIGLTVGRFVLCFLTPKIGERLAILLVFWLVPQYIVTAVAVGFQGFFLGPIFPAAIAVLSSLLPRHLHVGAIGFAAALGAGGATVLPFAVGAIAQAKGVQVLPPIVLAVLVIILCIWLVLLKGARKTRQQGPVC